MCPAISINISCYNRREMLRECLQSFINQTFQDWELILIDDGSDDDLSFSSGLDKRIKYYRQNHGGMARGLNLAMDKSTGDWIMPFGSDDLALPNLLYELYHAACGYSEEYDVIYSNGWLMKGDGRMKRKKHIEILDSGEAYKKMLEIQYITHGGTLWKKWKIPKYDEEVGSAEDWELFLTAMEKGVKFKHLNKKLWIYRVGHPREAGSDSQNNGCQKVLGRRGYKFDFKKRVGIKICR